MAEERDRQPEEQPAGDEPEFGGGRAPVSIYMADTVTFVPADAPIRAAAREMADAGVGALVVGTPERIEGVLSERDMLRVVSEGLDADLVPALQLATKELVWCDATATVEEVTTQMMEHYVRHVLVEEGGRLVGIVSARDILGAYAP